jgi:primosomal protein N' (replication factor Y)
MDADTTSAKGAHERLLTQFAQAPRAVLLGTQMIAKGLDFEDVTLVGVVNADTQLHLPDFRAQERTFDLVQQVAGRAGRGKLAGRVLVQTYEAQSPAIKAAAAYNRDAFLREELTKRKILKYPPYVQMANIIVWGKIESQVKAAAQDMYDLIRKTLGENHQESWEVLSPCACVLAKERDFFRWHIVIKAPLGSNMSEVLERVQRARKVDPYINVALDIDPASLL